MLCTNLDKRLLYTICFVWGREAGEAVCLPFARGSISWLGLMWYHLQQIHAKLM